MQTNHKFLFNIDSYIDVLTIHVLLKKQTVFWKIFSYGKLILKLKNSKGLVVR